MNGIIEMIKKRYKLFLVVFFSAIVAYLVLISNELTNTYDGMWKGTRYVEFDWVNSIGRWFWPFISELRKHLSPEPFTSICTIAMVVIGACLIISLLETNRKSTVLTVLVGLCIVINTAVCVRLSYRYMSPTFGASFLLSVCAVWIIEKTQKMIKWPVSTFLIVFSLGLYQADLGCTCFLFLIMMIRKVVAGDDLKKTALYVIKVAGVLLVGCILYKLIWDLILGIHGLRAANYQGASNLSASQVLTNLPSSILKVIRGGFKFYTGNNIYHNTIQSSILFRFVFIVAGLSIVVLVWKAFSAKRGWKRFLNAVIVVVISLLIPLASTVSLVLAPDASGITIQMTMPLELVLPVLLYLTSTVIVDIMQDVRSERFFRYSLCAALVLILYGNFLQVSIDQHIMLQSRSMTLSLMDRVITDLESSDMTKAGKFIFIGRPSDNPQYRKDEIWDAANSYAKYGAFWLGGNCGTQSYYGLMRDGGYNIEINWHDDYWHELEQTDFIKNMPVYPHTGYYFADGNGNVIVKLSQIMEE